MALEYNDLNYYAGFGTTNKIWSATEEYQMGDSVQYTTAGGRIKNYVSQVDGNEGNNPETGTGWEEITAEIGYYQFISLEDIVNNYMVLYGDDESHGGRPMRLKIEAFAQRAVQEFSYDVFKVKEWEIEVNDSCTIPFPQDYVDFVSLNYVDDYGNERWINPRLDSGAPQTPMQENDDESRDDGSYVYDDDGNIIYGGRGSSKTIERYDEYSSDNVGGIRYNNTSANFPSGVSGYTDYGKRYWADTSKANSNPTYVINQEDGTIYLEPSLAGQIVILRFVSDGLSSFAETKVHKFAEQAIYDNIYYEMILRNSGIPANEKERAKRRAFGKKKQAKMRLSNLSKRDLMNVLRGQSQWIKT